jgi:hypothetical protein
MKSDYISIAPSHGCNKTLLSWRTIVLFCELLSAIVCWCGKTRLYAVSIIIMNVCVCCIEKKVRKISLEASVFALMAPSTLSHSDNENMASGEKSDAKSITLLTGEA